MGAESCRNSLPNASHHLKQGLQSSLSLEYTMSAHYRSISELAMFCPHSAPSRAKWRGIAGTLQISASDPCPVPRNNNVSAIRVSTRCKPVYACALGGRIAHFFVWRSTIYSISRTVRSSKLMYKTNVRSIALRNSALTCASATSLTRSSDASSSSL